MRITSLLGQLVHPRNDLRTRRVWNGNESLLPDGRRPVIRTLTPVDSDRAALTFAV